MKQAYKTHFRYVPVYFFKEIADYNDCVYGAAYLITKDKKGNPNSIVDFYADANQIWGTIFTRKKLRVGKLTLAQINALTSDRVETLEEFDGRSIND